MIYLAFVGYAVYQLLPTQRTRAVHRATGWWLAVSAVLNMAWVSTFSARSVLLAEVLLLALLGVLARVYGRLSRERAANARERLALRLPVALYTGWVSLAVVAGTAATGVRLGLPGDGALGEIAAVLILLVAAGIVASVVTYATAVVGYAAAAVWALAGIALNAPPAAVGVAAAVAVGRRPVRDGPAGEHVRRPAPGRLGLSTGPTPTGPPCRRVRVPAGRSPARRRPCPAPRRQSGSRHSAAPRAPRATKSSEPSPGAVRAVTARGQHGRDRPDGAPRVRVEVGEPVAVGAREHEPDRPTPSATA